MINRPPRRPAGPGAAAARSSAATTDPLLLQSWNAFANVGTTGLRQASGWLYEEWERALQGDQGKRTLRMMLDSDPVIRAVQYTIEMLARQATWQVNPASPAQQDMWAKDRVEEAIFGDLDHPWSDVLSDMMTFPGWGFAVNEMTMKRRLGQDPGSYVDEVTGKERPLPKSRFDDGLVGVASLAGRAQETVLHWEFDDDGETTACVQMAPPDFKVRTIPMGKLLHFRTVNQKGNPQGLSVYRGAYEPWYLKRQIQKIEAIGIERDLTGMPVALIPPEYLKADASPDQKAFYLQVQRIVTNIKNDEQAGVVFPQAYDRDGHPMFELKLLATGGARAFDTSKVVDRYDQRIAASVLADFILIGSNGSGSLALARTKTNLFAVAMSAFMDHIADVINTRLIPHLCKLNGWKLKALPQVAHGRIAAYPLEDIAAYITALAGAGMQLFPSIDGELERRLLEMGDMPTPQDPSALGMDDDPAAQGDREQQDAQLADQGDDPNLAKGAYERARLDLVRDRRKRVWAGYRAPAAV